MEPPALRVAVVGTFPPPLFGSALMMQKICEIESKGITFYKFNTSFNTDYQQVGRHRVRKIWKLLWHLIRIPFFFRKQKIDLMIFTHSFETNLFLKDGLFFLAARLFGVKIILYSQASRFDRLFEKQPGIIQRLFTFLLHRCTAVVTVGKSMEQEYKRWFSEPRRFHIYNFLDESNLLPPIERKPKKIQLDGNAEKCRVLFLSTMIESKGILVLAKAAKIIQAEYDGIEIRMCGGYHVRFKHDKTEFEAYLAENNIHNISLGERVFGQEKVNEFLQADIFVFPSLYDAFGLVNLEAMAASLPIVASPQGAVPEYIIDGENGFIVPTGDARALAEKLIFLAHDHSLRIKMGMHNYMTVSTFYTKDRFQKEWLRVIRETCLS